jgi:hypothetical protein
MKLRRNTGTNKGFWRALVSSCLFFINLGTFCLSLLVLTAFIGWWAIGEMLDASTRKNKANIPADNTNLIVQS